jgi:hypothetical protein
MLLSLLSLLDFSLARKPTAAFLVFAPQKLGSLLLFSFPLLSKVFIE